MDRAIIVDLDGTLASCEHRRHYVEKKDWLSFYENMGHDGVHEWCKEIIQLFHEKKYKIL
jgi:histidinol phosphatase-like enzyme